MSSHFIFLILVFMGAQGSLFSVIFSRISSESLLSHDRFVGTNRYLVSGEPVFFSTDKNDSVIGDETGSVCYSPHNTPIIYIRCDDSCNIIGMQVCSHILFSSSVSGAENVLHIYTLTSLLAVEKNRYLFLSALRNAASLSGGAGGSLGRFDSFVDEIIKSNFARGFYIFDEESSKIYHAKDRRDDGVVLKLPVLSQSFWSVKGWLSKDPSMLS